MSFRIKLFVAMVLLVAGVTAATLFVTQRQVARAYQTLYKQQSLEQTNLRRQMQQLRLGAIKEKALTFVKSVRVIAAMGQYLEERDKKMAADLYDNTRNELFKPGSAEQQNSGLLYYRFLDAQGKVIEPEDDSAGVRDSAARATLNLELEKVGKALGTEQEIGYLAPGPANSRQELQEVIFTKIKDPVEDKVLGALVFGFASTDWTAQSSAESAVFRTVMVGDKLFGNLPPDLAQVLEEQKQVSQLALAGASVKGTKDRYLIFSEPLQESAHFPSGWRFTAYSLRNMMNELEQLRWRIGAFGFAGVLAAVLLSLGLAHGLSGPIQKLVRAAHQVQKGDFSAQVPVGSKDELGRLSSAFNEMTAGLALKEKYRSVLDMVADKDIAAELMSGKIALGGETREVSVLFCDIRGFTSMTQNMAPADVITLLNEHFTPLTKLVYERHGVVDKFVGDLIMAVFGAPKSYGEDARNAVLCGWEMLQHRRQMNESGAMPVLMGIGIASGRVVAGRMGSADRLSYTVLGERVNLASRLCGQAGKMELIIDESTFAKVQGEVQAEKLPDVKLKGYSELVPLYKVMGVNGGRGSS